MDTELQFYEYEDADLLIRLPLYLRQKKRTMRFFEAPPKKKREIPVHGFAIQFLSDQSVQRYQEILAFTDPRANEERMGVRGQVIRQGKPSYLADGQEALVATQIAVTGDTFYGYQVLFPLGSRHVHATFFGQGELSAFQESCKQIVSSIRLVEGCGERYTRSRVGRRTGGLGRADTSRLKRALDSLPPEIAYLRRPVMAIAKEDQDLLGSGEGDISPVERALRKNAGSGEIESIAETHAKLLHEWLHSLPDHEEAWAVPAWFVEGVLRGRALFGSDSTEP